MENNKLKFKKKNIILLVILIVSVSVLTYNVTVLVRWAIDRNKIIEETKYIEEIIEVVETKDTEEAEITNPPEAQEPNDYWDYVNLPFINVNLTELKKVNKDTVGFISVAGTNINYPVVQARDNKYYLDHSFQKKRNGAGWVFMDYRNNSDFSDKNIVIYGHGRLDTTMFGSLKNILETDWVNDKNNYTIRYVTGTETMLFQVFAVYTIPQESYYIETVFDSDTEYKEWLNTMINRSKYDFKTTINEKDKILTLSTCKEYSDGKERVVMHSKLIKKTKLKN